MPDLLIGLKSHRLLDVGGHFAMRPKAYNLLACWNDFVMFSLRGIEFASRSKGLVAAEAIVCTVDFNVKG